MGNKCIDGRTLSLSSWITYLGKEAGHVPLNKTALCQTKPGSQGLPGTWGWGRLCVCVFHRVFLANVSLEDHKCWPARGESGCILYGHSVVAWSSYHVGPPQMILRGCVVSKHGSFCSLKRSFPVCAIFWMLACLWPWPWSGCMTSVAFCSQHSSWQEIGISAMLSRDAQLPGRLNSDTHQSAAKLINWHPYFRPSSLQQFLNPAVCGQPTPLWRCWLKLWVAGAGKMAQQSGVFAVLLEGLSSVLSAYKDWLVTACNSSSNSSNTLSGLHGHPHMWFMHTQRHVDIHF